MAFHQPTRQFAQRVVRVDTDSLESRAPAPPVVSQTRDESQTWVLFSPATDAGTTTSSYLSSVQDSQPTPGRSRLSDLGSLNTIARSDLNSEHVNSVVASDVLDDDVIEDDAELDSLDSHLPDFRTVPNSHSQGFSQSIPILPTHDGLGSFRLDTQALGSEMQDQMYAFEQFNPRRVKRRRESLELAQLEIEREQAQEIERTRRIEEWRLDQSRILLEEIQKETRRRRQSQVSTQKLGSGLSPAEDSATLSTVGAATPETSLAGTDWHEQDGEEAARSQDGLWSRFTRRVIEDLMGIDDKTLSILFGEALPDETEDLSSTPKASAGSSNPTMRGEAESFRDSSWQLRMLDRIARELGMLVHHLSSHPHPGAFSTYMRMQQAPLPYAGLPVIPEGRVDANDPSVKNVADSTPTMPQFRPTVGQTQPMNIPGSRTAESAMEPAQPGLGDEASAAFTQQEWEQELDIKLVFRYLRSRFTNRSSSSGPYTSSASHLATSTAQDVAAKAARVRQHHPLVSRARQAERRTFKATAPVSPTAMMRHASSCASQSTRRSGRRGSLSVSSRHSSRHYWDIGGSIGTGSLIASTGPMGSWGEV